MHFPYLFQNPKQTKKICKQWPKINCWINFRYLIPIQLQVLQKPCVICWAIKYTNYLHCFLLLSYETKIISVKTKTMTIKPIHTLARKRISHSWTHWENNVDPKINLYLYSDFRDLNFVHIIIQISYEVVFMTKVGWHEIFLMSLLIETRLNYTNMKKKGKKTVGSTEKNSRLCIIIQLLLYLISLQSVLVWLNRQHRLLKKNFFLNNEKALISVHF